MFGHQKATDVLSPGAHLSGRFDQRFSYSRRRTRSGHLDFPPGAHLLSYPSARLILVRTKGRSFNVITQLTLRFALRLTLHSHIYSIFIWGCRYMVRKSLNINVILSAELEFYSSKQTRRGVLVVAKLLFKKKYYCYLLYNPSKIGI